MKELEALQKEWASPSGLHNRMGNRERARYADQLEAAMAPLRERIEALAAKADNTNDPILGDEIRRLLRG